MPVAKLVVLFGLFAAALVGCTSSADSEELARRTKLMTMEADNLRHERDVLQHDADQARAELKAAETRAVEAKAAGDDGRRDAEAARLQLAKAEAAAASLAAELAKVRDVIVSGRIDDRAQRAELLLALPAEVPPPGTAADAAH